MIKDKIKKYIVCVNGGSGVIFQPVDPHHSYILTAKHVFDDINARFNDEVNIAHFDEAGNGVVNFPKFNLVPGVNYFEHGERDIAILKVSRIAGAEDLLRMDDFDRYNKQAMLVGFPGIRRSKPNFPERLREDPNLEFLINAGNGLREAKIPDGPDYDELVGQSGGGLFCIEGNCIGILGIQNKVPTRAESIGGISFSPMRLFDDIADASGGAIEELYPSYLKHFTFLIPDIFNFPKNLQTQDAWDRITQVLRDKAEEIAKSELTPLSIRACFEQNQMLVNGQPSETLERKKLWRFWLEFLTVLNVVYQKVHTPGEYPDLFKSVRFFYSDVDDDFFVRHLDDLARTDYTGLEEGGVVIVSTNVAMSPYVFELADIPGDISRLERIHEKHHKEKTIDTATDFPFRKYKFRNLSAFKEDAVQNKSHQIPGPRLADTLNQLQQLYASYFV